MEKPIFISILILLFFILAGTLTTKALVTVKPGHAMVIERLGRYSRTLPAGFHWVIPFVDNPRFITWPGRAERINMIPLSQKAFEIPTQLQTKDGETLKADVRILWRVEDPVKAAYAVPALPEALAQQTTDTLQNMAAARTWQEIFTPSQEAIDQATAALNGAEQNWTAQEAADWAKTIPSGRDEMQNALQTIFKERAGDWGLVIQQSEILDLIPSPELQQKMEQALQEERAAREAKKESSLKNPDTVQIPG